MNLNLMLKPPPPNLWVVEQRDFKFYILLYSKW